MPEDIGNLPPLAEDNPDFNTYRTRSELQNHINFTADEAVARGDFKIIFPTNTRPYVGWIETTAAIDEESKADISEGWQYNIPADMIAEGETFNTQWADVWFDDTNKLFHANEAAGLYLVGKVEEVQNSDGNFKLLKRRYAILGQAT